MQIYHPKICYNSMADRKCTNLECRYFHLKYTKRYEQALSNQLQNDHHAEQQPRNYPPQSSYDQYSQEYVGSEQTPAPEKNDFLVKHITESNNTMKRLQDLINNLIEVQTRQVPQNTQPRDSQRYQTYNRY